MLVVLKDRLEKNIPTISYIDLFLSKNIQVTVLCYSCEASLEKYYINKKVTFIFTYKKFLFGFFDKIFNILYFRKKFKKIQKNQTKPKQVFFIGSFDTAFILLDLLKPLKTIIHVRELYEREFFFLAIMKFLASKKYQFIFTDYIRLSIYKTRIDFFMEPIVFPNKPFSHPRIAFKKKDFKESFKTFYSQLANKQVYLYQGYIGYGRNIESVAFALNKINNPSKVLVLMGSLTFNGAKYREYIKSIYSNTIFIPYISHPQYLKITSLAYVGLLSYSTKNLNNIFCSPNKMFEYTGFGIPVLGNDIPCLEYSINQYNFGFIFQENKVDDLINKIKEIDKNYSFYSKNANNFFDLYSFNDLFSKLSSIFPFIA
jgi:glycosyltransferase involved in cell wall biosynthesis